ncbi:hypothetical protein ACWY4P_29730 [Streptomyces sp. LZ34]
MAATVAACSRDGDSTSVKEQALKAFIKGEWEFKAENGSGGRLSVSDDGTWAGEGITGRWEHKGGRLTVTGDSGSDLGDREPFLIQDVPGTTQEALSRDYQLTGGLTDGQDAGYRNMQVRYRKGTVTLTFPDYEVEGAARVVTCARVGKASQ